MPFLIEGLQSVLIAGRRGLAGLLKCCSPGQQLQLTQASRRQNTVLSQLGQQTAQRGPVLQLNVELLKQRQHIGMTRMFAVQGIERFPRLAVLAPGNLQLSLGQANRKP